ncbi:uncharacterized protein TOT_030000158 [Theileria orientalis strain Shintoku]|uniref:Uncharacterized protein n=1 Tax=Theileria orientalis strain Shintoku TaxID=869250 RepID=J4CDC4_THEOR|nr:uncharacterized protein TOT_030000158 [Theileria orientalis strain Shintoku]BAM40897.1 uncharacterized protein TOT_030000158 [Theileria orientalis strain Shintoku]|eukprot:XP_009691198.1 uncharacterized protein TOT_030000158 [Theileria orientalis strain Shintoku]
MVKTRQTSEDSLSEKINRLKVCIAQTIKSSNVQRGSDICRRFDQLEEEPNPGIKTPKVKPKKHVEYELPDYTQWFDIDSINYIEEECADNIFIGYGHDKDALHEVYKKVRNKIVELYRVEPTRLLTVTDCIRRLGMDASIVMKVHSLLNYWGIINYQATNNFGEKIFNKRLNEQMVDLKGNQSNIHKRRVKLNFNQILDKDSTEANVNTYYNSLSYNDSTNYSSCTKKSFDFDSIEDVVRYSSELHSGHHGMDVNYPRCSGCSNPCKTSYYILGPDSLGEVNNSVRSRGLWCSLCYGNSNYPITLSKDSFVRIDLTPRLSETISKLFEQNRNINVKMPWTTEDFERLYEAIRKYGTDWQSVAQHMGEDSTPNECVFQFINAPLEKEVTSRLKLTTYMDPPTTSLLGAQFPFFDSPNTIVTLLSFCASVVSPVVASYAAKAAFNIILKASAKNSINGNGESTQIQESCSNDNSTNAIDTGEVAEGSSDLDDGTSTEGEAQNKGRSRKFVDGSTLQLAAAAALGAAAARAAELAEKEQERLSEALPHLISLKIKRITEKLNRYNETQEQMKSDQMHLVG